MLFYVHEKEEENKWTYCKARAVNGLMCLELQRGGWTESCVWLNPASGWILLLEKKWEEFFAGNTIPYSRNTVQYSRNQAVLFYFFYAARTPIFFYEPWQEEGGIPNSANSFNILGNNMLDLCENLVWSSLRRSFGCADRERKEELGPECTGCWWFGFPQNLPQDFTDDHRHHRHPPPTHNFMFTYTRTVITWCFELFSVYY